MHMLQTFDFESQAVRSLLRDDEPWFVLADVCRVLEIGNPSDAAKRLEDDEKMTLDNIEGRAGHGAQSYIIINESGIYALIFTSRKAQAKRFRKWVTKDVLPTLRRTGQYVISEEEEEILPSLAHGRLWGQPVAKINAAARMIGVAHRLYGPEAARDLWKREKGLPKLEKFSVVATIGNAADDARGCWSHLMRSAIDTGRTVGSLLDFAMHDQLTAKSLTGLGLMLDPKEAPGFLAIANSHRFLAALFAPTQWCGDWRLALSQLPGAKPSEKIVCFGGATSARCRAVLIPRETVLRLRHN
jgi:Prophage antirepressor